MNHRRDYQPSVFNPAFLPSLLRHFGFDEGESSWAISPRSSSYSLSEDDKYVYLELPMPGLEASDIQLTYDKGIVRIAGRAKREESNRRYFERAEYNYSFTLALPGDLDEQHEAEASYEQGVLKAKFAKAVKAQPKKITVSSR